MIYAARIGRWKNATLQNGTRKRRKTSVYSGNNTTGEIANFVTIFFIRRVASFSEWAGPVKIVRKEENEVSSTDKR
ncbi:MAG: hypothetical protein ACYSSO_13780 [Planctomycetota bacterium]